MGISISVKVNNLGINKKEQFYSLYKTELRLAILKSRFNKMPIR